MPRTRFNAMTRVKPFAASPRFQPFGLRNFRRIPQLNRLDPEQIRAIDVAARVLPFRTNNYVIDELIDWSEPADDPLFTLTFPRREMLLPRHYHEIDTLLRKQTGDSMVQEAVQRIRSELNPHPGGQLDDNIPFLAGSQAPGLQHKYQETLLFFPQQGQTCHAYCSFCFRWPQFTQGDLTRFGVSDSKQLIHYLARHRNITDVLFTGGDPLVMKAQVLASYIDPLLKADLPSLLSLRLGTKALSFWPYRFVTDDDSEALLQLFRRIVDAGKHLSIMAHFSHPRELQTEVVEEAIWNIRATGAQIRTQAPLLAHINDQADLWSAMWRHQVRLGCIPYYMFVVRNTGAQPYFSVPLQRAWEIFRQAYSRVSGLARTVRGPIMSARPGKIQILGVEKIQGEEVFVLQMLQGRDPDWVARPFFARYDEQASWLHQLRPALGGERFFFENSTEGGRTGPGSRLGEVL